jgi:hypothetical protein
MNLNELNLSHRRPVELVQEAENGRLTRGLRSCPVQPPEGTHPVLHRPPLLPEQVRRKEDLRSLLRHTEG